MFLPSPKPFAITTAARALTAPLHRQDTRALSVPAQRTALEVLAANNAETIIQRDDGVTPTPVISRAILVYNRGRKRHPADGIVITPLRNPPEASSTTQRMAARLKSMERELQGSIALKRDCQ